MAAFCCCWGKEFKPIVFECLNTFKEEEVEEETPAFEACTTARAVWTLILRNIFMSLLLRDYCCASAESKRESSNERKIRSDRSF